MNKRQLKHFNEIKALAKLKGWKLLSDRYVNNIQYLSFECPGEHRHLKTAQTFKKVKGCDICDKFKNLLEIQTIAISKGWKLLSDRYVNSEEHLSFECPKGHQQLKTAYSFKKGKDCAICNRSKDFLDQLELEGYKILDDYVHCLTKVSLICPESHLWKVKPDNFKHKNRRCSICRKRKLTENFEREFFTFLHEEGYKTLDRYVDSSTKLNLICPQGHLWLVKPHAFKIQGSRCPRCPNQTSIDCKERFITQLKANEYNLLGDYTYVNSKVLIQCPAKHHVEISPGHFSEGKRCRKCAGLCPEEAEKSFLVLVEKENYEILSEYINTYTRVLVKCPNQHYWNVSPDHFKRGVRCKHCPRSESKGEALLRKTLDKLGLEHTPQMSFTFLSKKRYDEYFTFNGNRYVVEFDGTQHFKYIPHFHDGNISVFHQKQHVDIIKTYYPIHNGIKVIRISVKEINDIEKHILDALRLNWALYVSNTDLYKYILEPLSKPVVTI